MTLQAQATQPVLPRLSEIDQEEQSNIREESQEQNSNTVIMRQNEPAISQNESNDNYNRQVTVIQGQNKGGIDQESIPIDVSEGHKEKTAKVNENSAMINTEGFEQTSQTQINLQTLSNVKSSNSQAEIKKD